MRAEDRSELRPKAGNPGYTDMKTLHINLQLNSTTLSPASKNLLFNVVGKVALKDLAVSCRLRLTDPGYVWN
jgi:hypothetical protein